ncbi:MAG: anaerobic ribonucleoside-triphosphate reductase activating protein [Marinilabiliaceae bacterium]|nr:anaerobic ribonucleoside-triphosphate reductase activating protein [Marinilabiliaceae bacterium]
MYIFVLKIVESTTVDGPGLRNSVYCAGCVNQCPGCHNPQSWDIMAGRPMHVEEIAQRLLSDDMCNITFTGGDPMYQAKGFTELAKIIKSQSKKSIWCYSGYTFEEIIKDQDKRALLPYIDILVDGRFVQALRNTDLLFRGSSNQRLIDVQKSLAKGRAILYDYDPYPYSKIIDNSYHIQHL